MDFWKSTGVNKYTQEIAGLTINMESKDSLGFHIKMFVFNVNYFLTRELRMLLSKQVKSSLAKFKTRHRSKIG